MRTIARRRTADHFPTRSIPTHSRTIEHPSVDVKRTVGFGPIVVGDHLLDRFVRWRVVEQTRRIEVGRVSRVQPLRQCFSQFANRDALTKNMTYVENQLAAQLRPAVDHRRAIGNQISMVAEGADDRQR